MAALPEPTGPYSVSTFTIEIPVAKPRTFLADKYAHRTKSTQDTRPAFQLRTVAVTLYYPTNPSPTGSGRINGQTWLPAPRFKSLTGLLKYASLSSWWAYPIFVPAWWTGLWGARLPTSQAQPLASRDGYSDKRWPTAVFSPGLAGTATTYSVYCSRVASHGVVVAALDHRDGTSPSSLVHLPVDNGQKVAKTEEVVYTREEEITHSPDDEDDEKTQDQKWHFRRTQLAFRRSELSEAVKVLDRINMGQGKDVLAESTRQVTDAEKQAYFGPARLPEWAERLDLGQDASRQEPCLIGLGHSFGAATLMSCLDPQLAPVDGLEEDTQRLGAAVEDEQRRLAGPAFRQVVLLDPWVEPLALPTATSASRSAVPPFCAIVSQGFALWVGHFSNLEIIASSLFKRQRPNQSTRSWMATLSGSRHTDFSDFPWILPHFFARHLTKTSYRVSDFMDIFETLTLRAIFGDGDGEGDEAQATARSNRARLHGMDKRWEKPGEIDSKDLGPPGVLIRHPLPARHDGVTANLGEVRAGL